MLLNADRLKRVVSNTNKIPWVNSPISSIELRMIEVMPLHNYGSENIALVKWQPGTIFQKHSHWG